jgi:glutamate formiminotransferase
VIQALESAFSSAVSLLDRHSDADHNRTVLTIAGEDGALRDALVRGAGAAAELIDMSAHEGLHPAVGALDVCPLVWIDAAGREAAHEVAVEVGEGIGELGVPVFFYGSLASGPDRVERAYFRNGGLAELWLRMEAGELAPDRGPGLPHRTAGVTLVTARPPLAAFNVELDSDDVETARSVAAGLRESGGGLAGVRAIGLALSSGRTQVSTNIQDPLAVPLGTVVRRVRELAAGLDARPVEAELVGLVPAGGMAGYPEDVPLRGFDPDTHVIERRLGADR